MDDKCSSRQIIMKDCLKSRKCYSC